ncbi:prolipoprotein diacylglyceryl transferase family protein [Paenibacillus tarimensis]
MAFPVYIDIGPWSIHPHVLFEALAYFMGFRVYVWTRTKGKMPFLQGLQIIAGAAVGAAVGSKLLYLLEDLPLTLSNYNDLNYLLGGKTIVGGLLGGLIGVELVKKWIGWRSSTGDDFVLPLIAGIAIGRIGCFLTGLEDKTHGTPTTWMTGVDFGDGIYRHPAQLYEIGWLLLLGTVLLLLRRRLRNPEGSGSRLPSGALFQLFMCGYLLFRLLIDFMKPVPHPYFGLNNIQLACLAGLFYYAWVVSRWRKHI